MSVGVGKQDFGDRERLQSLLNDHKLCASSLTSFALECSNPDLTKDVVGVLERTIDHQKRIYNAMATRGFYQVQPASPEDVTRVQKSVAQMGQATQVGQAGQVGQMGQPTL